MKKFLFLINYYNDVDHTAPLMNELLRRGHTVSVICLTQYSIRDDLRIRRLSNHQRFHVHPFVLLPRNFGKSNRETGPISFHKKLFREALFNFLFATFFLRLYGYDVVIFTWGRPRAKGFQRQIFKATKLLAIPTFCLPHGQNIYINYDVNQQLRDLYSRTGRWPDFSDRNEFTGYVVQSERHRLQHVDWGMDSEKVFAWGSLRFDPPWVTENVKNFAVSDAPTKLDSPEKLGVVFFLPHWRYNVDETATLALIKLILEEIDVHLVIKGHTRGDRLTNEMLLQLKPFTNIDLDSSHESTPLIDWADAIINFGSSIALEAIVRRRPVIFPSYLHTNRTIFDNETCVIDCQCSRDVTLALRALRVLEKPSANGDNSRDRVLNTEVFNHPTAKDIAKEYADNILKFKTR